MFHEGFQTCIKTYIYIINVCADIYHHELTTRRNFISVTKKDKKQKTENKNKQKYIPAILKSI